MCKNRGFIVGMSNEAIKKLIENQLFYKVFAEENPNDDGDNTPKPTPSINYEDLIAKARKEEKDKQYKTIEKLKTQIDTLTEQHNADLLKIAGLEQKITEAETKLTNVGSGDSEAVKTLKGQIATLTSEKEALENKVNEFKSKPVVNREDVEAEVRKELEAEYEVKTYKATKLAEMKDDILVPELVFGNTKEEIDESIKTALERSEAIKKSLGVTGKQQKRTPRTPSNPSVSKVQDSELSIDYIASLDVGSPEYLEVRKQLGLR